MTATRSRRRHSQAQADRRHRCLNCNWWDPTPWLCVDCWRMAIISGAGGGAGMWALGHMFNVVKRMVNGG